MKSRFITDPQDPSDSFLYTAGVEVYTSFSPLAGKDGGDPASNPVEIPSTPALTSEAVAASSAQSGPTSTISMTSGGITINLLFDAAAMAAPASFRAGIQQAASLLTAAISDQITVNIKIDYSGIGGGAAAGPDSGQYLNYSTVKSDLINNATPGDTTFNALPAGSSVQGQTNVAVWNAQLKLWGVLGARDTTTDDGSATFATDINSSLLVGVALHELTHAMGRVPYGSPYSSSPDIFDLFRFTSPGVRMFSGASTASAAYFSVDGGNTKLADFGQTSDPSDFLNSGAQGPNDPFNEFYTGGTIQSLTAVDKLQLDALGFHTAASVTTTVIESFGSTSLVEIGSNFYLNSGAGPELKYSGAAVVAGPTGWLPIGAEQTATGYEVAWKVIGVDQYTVWNTDSSGNYVSNAIGAVSGTSAALQSLETSFHQDLNGDGVIGAPATVIESIGSTSLVEIGSNFYLNSGAGPELKYGGAAVVAGPTGWLPLGAEQTATGYEVAWKVIGVDQYTVWNTDSSGNYVSNAIGAVPGSSAALESLETSFHQDLNGDGVIGVPAASQTVIEAFGSTSLVEIGSNFYLNSGAGPELKYGGAAVVAGPTGWLPIGAEQTATGYEVAWKVIGVDQYTVWNTDSSGNYVSNAIGAVSGTSAALQSLETSFHQDLNGDGVIGAPATVIESFGSTSLVEIGSNFYLNSGAGPELKYGGAAVVAGPTGWLPLGVEQTATGYEVAWKVIGVDQYTVWNTDSSGNYVSNAIGAVSGTSAALQALETSFHQDLNGDGIIGVPAASQTVIEAFGSTSLVEIGSNFYLNSGAGPELKYGGAAVVAGPAGWLPIGAEQTATGYEVAWKVIGVDQYTVWNTDSNGNYVSNAIGAVSGTSSALKSLEASFHQDLNGDGVISVPTSPASLTSEPTGASSDFVAFTGSPSILGLDTPSTFSGQIVGFTGDGTLAGSDQIDLRGMNYNSIHSSFDSATGVLALSDGSTTANLQYLGHYSQESFRFADDGRGGTVIYGSSTSAPPNLFASDAALQIASNSQVNVSTTGGQDTFVFAPHFGQVTIAHFTPETDVIQISRTIFASMDALLRATQDDPHGNAVITDAAYDTISIQNLTKAQLQSYQSDFHFV